MLINIINTMVKNNKLMQNKQKLLSRLVCKFDPIRVPKQKQLQVGKVKGSNKSLNRIVNDSFSKDISIRKFQDVSSNKHNESDVNIFDKAPQRNRSITNVRLPSIQQKKINPVQQEKKALNLKEMRGKIRSMKHIPIIGIESQTPINHTLNYLLKQEILTVPQIILMLQRARSEQFFYLVPRKAYQYEICQKGASLVTISRNGMVQNGEIIGLDQLKRQYKIFSKLQKVSFFKHYFLIKYMNKWNRGSKKANFVETKNTIEKKLFLDTNRTLNWKQDLKNSFIIQQTPGSLLQNWVAKVNQEITVKKANAEKYLFSIIYDVLQKFNLPISQSEEVITKVLTNLYNLKLSYEEKLRIEKQLQTVYKLGRLFQCFLFEEVIKFLFLHLTVLIDKIQLTVENYKQNILGKLYLLNIHNENYTMQKNAVFEGIISFNDIDTSVTIDENELIFDPNGSQIYKHMHDSLNQFLKNNIDLKIVRGNKFKFLITNVFKGAKQRDDQNTWQQQIAASTQYVLLNKYLKTGMDAYSNVCEERKALFQLFFNLVDTLNQKKSITHTFSNQQLEYQIALVDQEMKNCQKIIQDQEPFIFGNLHLQSIKKYVLTSILQYKERLIRTIPQKIIQAKKELNLQLSNHVIAMEVIVNSPTTYIEINNKCEELENNISGFVFCTEQIQRLIDFFLKIQKNQNRIESGNQNLIMNVYKQKLQINQLKNKLFGFKQKKQNLFLKYRKELQQDQKNIKMQMLAFDKRQEMFYKKNQNPFSVYEMIVNINNELQKIKNKLTKMNKLQEYFDLKTTYLPKLQLFSLQYEHLMQIWQIYMKIKENENTINKENIFHLKYINYLKQAQEDLSRIIFFLTNMDYYQLCQELKNILKQQIQCLFFVKGLQEKNVRIKDIEQINLLFKQQKLVGSKNLIVNKNDIFYYNNSNLTQPQQSFDIRKLTFDSLKTYKLYKYSSLLQQILVKSKKEQQIQLTIQQFNIWWKQIRLQYTEVQNVILFGANDIVRKDIEQHTINLLSIINNKYGSKYRSGCLICLQQINHLASLLELTQEHQQKFVRLQYIMTSKYIEKQLPIEFKKFQTIVDKALKGLRLLQRPTEQLEGTNSKDIASKLNMRVVMTANIKMFDSIEKVLQLFLEAKRVKFQRFYFLQDDELIWVLVGEGDRAFRMFQGVKGWLMDREGIKVGVEGVGGEKLFLRGWSYKLIEPQILFRSLEDALRQNLHSVVRNIIHNYETLKKYSVDVCLCSLNDSFCETNLNQLLPKQSKVPHSSIFNSIKYLSPYRYCYVDLDSIELTSANYITLQLSLLHFVQQLEHHQVESVRDFRWSSFLRYYYKEETVLMRAVNAEWEWGGQYQGLWTLMVNTSDIRRAHCCVLLNVKYGNGVLLQGPAGTGKTQSLKQLARCMAKYCVLFNCSAKLQIRTLTKLLSGLCYTASWLCLDQINRLAKDVMSVLANHIDTIKQALVKRKESFLFGGREIKVKEGVGVFATMNPIYLKRAELTENLKEYFRVISITVPQYDKILEVFLWSMGFTSAFQNALKISNAFRNLSIQLKNHDQYDFGLRAMRSLMQKLGGMPKTTLSIGEAIYATFYARLNPEDQQTFRKIIYDIFCYKQEKVLSKVQTMKQSFQSGIIVMGETSCKTQLIASYTQGHNVTVFNPSSMDIRYFLGQKIGSKWQEGVVQQVVKKSVEKQEIMHFLILDGRLKSETIQNFNSLLDDSRVLSIANGTRVKIQSNFKLIMETQNLKMTSPATITRCLIVYLSQQDVSIDSIIQRNLPLLQPYDFEKFHEMLFQFKQKDLLQIFKLVQLFIPQANSKNKKKQQFTKTEKIMLQKCLIFSIQLLGYGEKIQRWMTKDNSISLKKNPLNFYLSFQKYAEGQFIQFVAQLKPYVQMQGTYVPTVRSKMCQFYTKRSYEREINIFFKCDTRRDIRHLLNKTTIDQVTTKQISVTKWMNSATFTKAFQVSLTSSNVLIYVDNLHLSSEQVQQTVRFIIEHKQVYNYKSNTFNIMPPFIFLSSAANFQQKRLSRHFVQLPFPKLEEYDLRQIYSVILQEALLFSNLNKDLKEQFSTELYKISELTLSLIKNNNKALKFISAFKNVRHLTDQKNVEDIMCFLIRQMLDVEEEFYFKECFIKTYGYKYVNALSKAQKGCFTTIFTNSIMYIENKHLLKDKLQNLSKDYFFSQLFYEKIFQINKVVGWNNKNYFLTGALGKKSLFRLAIKLMNQSVIETIPTQERKIIDWYFQLTKNQQKQYVLCNVNTANQLLLILDRIYAGFNLKQMLSSEDADYAYGNIDILIKKNGLGKIYNKAKYTFQQVINDYFSMSSWRVIFLFTGSQSEHLRNNYKYVEQRTVWSELKQFPEEAIAQTSIKILSECNENANRLSGLFLKIYKDMRTLRPTTKYNAFIHFKFVHAFVNIYKTMQIQNREKEDLLTKAIMKLYQTNQTLENIKKQILEGVPLIQKKRNQISLLMPVLQERKRQNQRIKEQLLQQRRQIQFKNNQIQIKKEQIQQKIRDSEPLLQETNDSLNLIKRQDISEIKNNPHLLVKITLQNLAILLNESESADSIKKLLSDPNLMLRIKSAQPQLKNVYRIVKRIEQNPDWTYENVVKVAYGSRCLFKWVKGVVRFSLLKQSIEQQKQKIAKLKESSAASIYQLTQKQLQLTLQQKAIGKTLNEYLSLTNELNQLQQRAVNNRLKAENASNINLNLKDELIRWNQQLRECRQFKKHFEGNAIKLTCFLQLNSCLQEPLPTIEELLQKWQFIPHLLFDAFQYYKNINKIKLPFEQSQNQKIVVAVANIKNNLFIIDPDNQFLKWAEQWQTVFKETISKETLSKQIAMKEIQRNIQMAQKQNNLILLFVDDLQTYALETLKKITNKAVLISRKSSSQISQSIYLNYKVINFTISNISFMLQTAILSVQAPEMLQSKHKLQNDQLKNVTAMENLEHEIIRSLVNQKQSLINDNAFLQMLKQSNLRSQQLSIISKNIAQQISTLQHFILPYKKLCSVVVSIYNSLKIVVKFNPLLKWNLQILLQYFKMALINSITTRIIQENVNQNNFSQHSLQFQYEQYVDLHNSRASINSNSSSRIRQDIFGKDLAIRETQKESNYQENVTFDMLFENTRITDQNQKKIIHQEREKNIISAFLRYLLPAFNQQQKILWGIILCFQNHTFQSVKTLLTIKEALQAQVQKDKNKIDQNDSFIKYASINSKIEIDQLFVQNEKQKTEQNNIHKQHTDKVNETENKQILFIEFLKGVLKYRRKYFVKAVGQILSQKNFNAIHTETQVTSSDWIQRSDCVHPVLLIMGQDPIVHLSEFFLRKKFKNVLMVTMGDVKLDTLLQRESKKQVILIVNNLHIVQHILPSLSRLLQQFQIRPPNKFFRLILISSKSDAVSRQIGSFCHKYFLQQTKQFNQNLNRLLQKSPRQQLSSNLAIVHSIGGALSRYKNVGWNGNCQFNTADYLHSLKILKEITTTNFKFECNIDAENYHYSHTSAAQYLIGDITYVGKLSDDIDRKRMKAYLKKHLFKEPQENKKMSDYLSLSQSQICGLHQNVTPNIENAQFILLKLYKIYQPTKYNIITKNNLSYSDLNKIQHKLEYINQEIKNFNQQKNSSEQYEFLKVITATTKTFNLRAFNKPSQFFTAILRQFAIKNQLPFDNVELSFSFINKENVYSIQKISLQGGSIINGQLQDNYQQNNITIYITGKKKEKKKLVSIPLYLTTDRMGIINSYGQNSNLLTLIKLQSHKQQQFWLMRGTAFIVQ